jgi:hypothetical protein
VEKLDILNSKIKKIRIELPEYHFSHSSSGDSSHTFIGRKRILEKLTRIVADSPDESGVYLVAGNRGVGKTSLVSEVIKRTSLQVKSNILKRLKDLFDIKKYWKNHNRMYLRINFGHKLRDEKDILRLIARTLSTEYGKYLHSLWRMLPWRVMAFGLLFLSTYLFGAKVSDSVIKIWNNFYAIFSTEETTVSTKIMAKTDAEINTGTKIVTKTGTHGGNLLFKLDQYINNIFACSKYYKFGLSFLLIYLFFVLLFRSTWVTRFFITHRIINRRLKKLNDDITHSTERENALRINAGNVGTGIGTKTRKSRNIADAREIEKELQDILNDMRRICPIMSRPKVVIVFDELDKVEPGDAGSEKEIPQTKASMFSIGATRERQTEILRILSNLKYFLSTASAKFIFIAGREMFDIHLADVSERNNYIGSIFNAVIYVPSFLADHPTSKKSIREESSIASLPEEFVCRRLFPRKYKVKTYNLKSYREYLETKIFGRDTLGTEREEAYREEKIQKIIAVLQQFIIYLAHVSKGAPKKMVQLFESFVEIHVDKDKYKRKNILYVRRNRKAKYFLTFNYYKQYTLGIIAYLITPIFHRLAESNVKEHSDKLLVSSLRFVDFLFKFHKQSFSWKHLDISPEMLEANRAPELKSVVVDLLNYLTRVHINKSNFSLSDYKFDSVIANEIFAMTKTDEVFSALFSFSLDEMLPLKKHYQDLLDKTEKEYQDDKSTTVFIDAISSLQVVLGDMYYYDDELEEAEVYYKNAVQALRRLEQKSHHKEEKIVDKTGGNTVINNNNKKTDDEKMTTEQFYRYVRSMLRLGMIYEKRKQYDYAYLTYGGLCNWIIRERNITIKDLSAGVVLRKSWNGRGVFVKASKASKIDEMYYDNIDAPLAGYAEDIDASIASPQPLYFKNLSPNTNDALFKKMTFEGLKMLYLPFIAKLQILEQSHHGGITRNHLEQLDREFNFLTYIIDHNEAKLLEAEFYSRVADVLYYKNSDLKCKNNKNRKKDYEETVSCHTNDDTEILPENKSCTACYYYHKALSVLLNLDKTKNMDENTVTELLRKTVEQIKEIRSVSMKYYTILARILSDWGNVFFSCDNMYAISGNGCYICDRKNRRTVISNSVEMVLERYFNYMNSESKKENYDTLLNRFIYSNYDFTKMEIAFAMYSISTTTYRKAGLYKRSAYQIYKILRLFNHYGIYNYEWSRRYIEQLSNKAIHYLWYANEDLSVPELNKRKKDFDKNTIGDWIPLQNLLVDTEITRVRILVKELELKLAQTPEDLKKFYDMRITSPYKVNYSVVGRIYRLRLKSKVNEEAYKTLINNKTEDIKSEIERIFKFGYCDDTARRIFGISLDTKDVFENLVAETIYCLIDIVQLTKTMGETYLFPHSFLGSVHRDLSRWIRRYETYEDMHKGEKLQIEGYLKKYLDEEWREMLSGYRENQQALSHYYQALEMHNEGRAYHNMIDTMCYVRDDYNDRSDHFNTAEERHLMVNGEIEKEIDELKKHYENSELYKVDNYFR